MGMGDIIKSLRMEYGWTQEELGEKLGVQKSAVRKWEKGTVENIKRTTIEKMSEIFCVEPCYLMGWGSTQLSSSTNVEALVAQIKATYGEKSVDLLETYAKLDEWDRVKLEERMAMLLEAEKYNPKKERKQP